MYCPLCYFSILHFIFSLAFSSEAFCLRLIDNSPFSGINKFNVETDWYFACASESFVHTTLFSSTEVDQVVIQKSLQVNMCNQTHWNDKFSKKVFLKGLTCWLWGWICAKTCSGLGGGRPVKGLDMIERLTGGVPGELDTHRLTGPDWPLPETDDAGEQKTHLVSQKNGQQCLLLMIR